MDWSTITNLTRKYDLMVDPCTAVAVADLPKQCSSGGDKLLEALAASSSKCIKGETALALPALNCVAPECRDDTTSDNLLTDEKDKSTPECERSPERITTIRVVDDDSPKKVKKKSRIKMLRDRIRGRSRTKRVPPKPEDDNVREHSQKGTFLVIDPETAKTNESKAWGTKRVTKDGIDEDVASMDLSMLHTPSMAPLPQTTLKRERATHNAPTIAPQMKSSSRQPIEKSTEHADILAPRNIPTRSRPPLPQAGSRHVEHEKQPTELNTEKVRASQTRSKSVAALPSSRRPTVSPERVPPRVFLPVVESGRPKSSHARHETSHRPRSHQEATTPQKTPQKNIRKDKYDAVHEEANVLDKRTRRVSSAHQRACPVDTKNTSHHVRSKSGTSMDEVASKAVALDLKAKSVENEESVKLNAYESTSWVTGWWEASSLKPEGTVEPRIAVGASETSTLTDENKECTETLKREPKEPSTTPKRRSSVPPQATMNADKGVAKESARSKSQNPKSLRKQAQRTPQPEAQERKHKEEKLNVSARAKSTSKRAPPNPEHHKNEARNQGAAQHRRNNKNHYYHKMKGLSRGSREGPPHDSQKTDRGRSRRRKTVAKKPERQSKRIHHPKPQSPEEDSQESQILVTTDNKKSNISSRPHRSADRRRPASSHNNHQRNRAQVAE